MATITPWGARWHLVPSHGRPELARPAADLRPPAPSSAARAAPSWRPATPRLPSCRSEERGAPPQRLGERVAASRRPAVVPNELGRHRTSAPRPLVRLTGGPPWTRSRGVPRRRRRRRVVPTSRGRRRDARGSASPHRAVPPSRRRPGRARPRGRRRDARGSASPHRAVQPSSRTYSAVAGLARSILECTAALSLHSPSRRARHVVASATAPRRGSS